MSKTLYKDKFYKNRNAETESSAEAVMDIILPIINPCSLIDLGCGTGEWLSVAKSKGVGEVCGLDGDYVNRQYLAINQNEFHPANLENSIELSRKYDMAMSLEVAEHLSKERADSFVADLTCLSDVIMFGAAIKHQGGIGHINERPLSYWKGLFEKYDYVIYDIIRPKVWDDSRVKAHYKNNIVIFVNKNNRMLCDRLDKELSENIVDYIHPEMYEYMFHMYKGERDKDILLKIKYFIKKIIKKPIWRID